MSGAWKLRGYVVEHLLGSGGSARVWRAHVAATGEPVALKRLAVQDEAQLRRAHAEAAKLSALDHPHLVRLHAFVPEPDSVVLVLDLAEGGSLAELLAIRGRLTPGEVITAIAPVAAALAHIHAAGVVHGDVSAANILFTPGGVPMLADLGVARLTGDDTDAESTPAYVDPAVAAGCMPGPQSDVFMLAAVALHALTGSPPWRGVDPDTVLAAARAAARADELTDVRAGLVRADVPEQMAIVVRRALSVDPHRRGTAADLALELRHSGEPVAVELAAGLPRREPNPDAPEAAGRGRAATGSQRPRGGRHAAVPLPASPGRRARVAQAPGPVRAAIHARPTFDQQTGRSRPVSGTGGAPRQPPTRAVAARARPVIPRPVRRRVRPRLLAGAGAVLLAAALASAGVFWSRADHSDAAGRHGPAARPTQLFATPTMDWTPALAGLDSRRARAFATRNLRVLAQVYAPGPLLAADTRLLVRLVPPGCGLVGATTRFENLRASERGSRVLLTVTASLPPSRLVCSGRTVRTARGTGPSTLRIELARTAQGLRIAGEEVS